MSNRHTGLDGNSTKAGTPSVSNQQRRQALLRIGRSLAYAAPATLLALTMQANAASTNG